LTDSLWVAGRIDGWVTLMMATTMMVSCGWFFEQKTRWFASIASTPACF
jgi:hypothetical protein